MTDRFQQIQLTALAVIVGLITVGSFVYISWKQPASLQRSRDGVPFFTPAVINPDTGNAISVDELVKHYKKGG